MRRLRAGVRPSVHWGALLLALLLLACGDDKQAEDDGFIDVPGDAATFQDALETARNGARIRVQTDTLRVDQKIVVRELEGLEIVGRENSAQQRPVLLADLPGNTVIEIETTSPGCVIRGLEIRGTFFTGVRVRASDSVVTDCRIEDGIYSIHCTNGAEGVRIESNLLLRPRSFGVYCAEGATPLVQENSIIESRDCGIYTVAASPTCERNLIARSVNWGFACFNDSEPMLSCNGIFGGGKGPYLGCDAGDDDMEADPLICDEVTYALSPESPYLSGPCGRVGAVGACE